MEGSANPKMTTTISGRELALLASSSYLNLLSSRGVAPNTTISLRQIERTFGESPSISGHNIPAIIEIRDAIFRMSLRERFDHAIMICAPHTHWDSLDPIIVSYDGTRYAIGPQKPKPKNVYTPISFVFSPEGPLPFEWADETVALSESDVKKCHSIITKLNRKFQSKQWPLAVALNFRFKSLFSQARFASIENPSETILPGYAEASTIERYTPRGPDANSEQVAWHAYSDKRHKLSDRELGALCLLRDHLEFSNDGYARALAAITS